MGFLDVLACCRWVRIAWPRTAVCHLASTAGDRTSEAHRDSAAELSGAVSAGLRALSMQTAAAGLAWVGCVTVRAARKWGDLWDLVGMLHRPDLPRRVVFGPPRLQWRYARLR